MYVLYVKHKAPYIDKVQKKANIFKLKKNYLFKLLTTACTLVFILRFAEKGV